MIEVIRDKNGNITAVCEWLLFNETGMIDDKGKALFVGEFEINKEHRGNGVFKKVLRKLYTRNPQATHAMWFRNKKYPGRGLVVKTRDQIRRVI
jgi:hypothetical protein